MSDAPRVQGMCEAARGRFGVQLGPDPSRRIGVGEEDRAERDRTRPGRDQLERVEPGAHSAHADDRQVDGRRAGVDGRQRDRLQGRTGVAARCRGRASGGASARRVRARGACSRARARRPRRPPPRAQPRRCPRPPARASRREAGSSRRGRRRRSPPRSRAPRRRSGRRGSARSPSTSSSAAHVSAYSPAEKPPTETQSGTPSSASRGRSPRGSARRPGFASPIEFSIPTSVSAIRTGGLPSRGSGVIVFVTKASSERATSGAVSASRQPEALSSTEHRSSTQRRLSSPSISTAQP